MKKIAFITLVGVSAIFLLLLGADEEGPKRAGYFKSSDNDRVIAYTTPSVLSEIDARAILRGAPVTRGAKTVAVLYGPDSLAPSNALTAAPSFIDAVRIVTEGPHADWVLRMRVNPAGKVTFD